MILRSFLLAALAALAGGPTPASRFFAGPWNCRGAFASGRPIAAEVTFTPVLGGRWLEYHHVDAAPGRYEALALWPGADTASPQPVVLYDNGGGHRRFIGSGWATDTVRLIRDSTDPGAHAERFTFRATSDSSYWFGWEIQRAPGAPWVLGDSLSCRRGIR
jgi:hypothetical protein